MVGGGACMGGMHTWQGQDMHGREACMPRGCTWPGAGVCMARGACMGGMCGKGGVCGGGVHGRGHAWWEACVAGGMHAQGV